MMRIVLPLSVAVALAGACADDPDPVEVSEVVGIELKADADKVVGATLTDEKNINTESGNPYGAFVSDATQQLGRAPGRIEVETVDILIGAGSDVTELNQIFDGEVEVLFVMNGSSDTIPVASVLIDQTVQGGGPVALEPDYDWSTLSSPNFDDLVSGNFKVVYRGPTTVGYSGGPQKCNLQLDFTFVAFAE
jgi:hypothetical protein